MPQPGEDAPDLLLTNQDGRQVRLRDYRCKSILLTFIYTRCPHPDFCPLMTHNFAQIEQALTENQPVYQKTHLLSISFDPEHVTPAVLRAYAQSQSPNGKPVDFRHWEFAPLSSEQR